LCDEALPRLEAVVRWLPVGFDVVDITTNPELESEYHLRIPVVLDRRGRVVAEGQISSLAALQAGLSALL
jgi:hypothetical protein